MGEHAEEALDDLLFGRGSEGGLFSYGPDYPTSIRCKRCGEGPFEWCNVGTWREPQWRLFDDDHNMHHCSQERLAKLMFEPLE